MKRSFFVIFLSFITSSVYAYSNFCSEADLSDEQRAHTKELHQEFRASVEGLSKEERRAKWGEFSQTILDAVADSEEQKVALAKCFEQRKNRRHNRHKCFEEAGFSDEQRAHMKELRQEFKASVKSLSKEERRAKWGEFPQTVLDTVADSEEQKAALAKCFEQRWKHCRKRQ